MGHADGESNGGGILDFKVFGSNLWDETSTVQIETSKSKWGKKAQCVHDITVLKRAILAQYRAFIA